MKKIDPNKVDEIEPEPSVVKIVRKSKRNPKRDAKREKRDKRKISNRNLYNSF